MEKYLSVNDLKVIYTSGRSTVHAVNGASFELQKKQTLGLVGETGAGKTTIALSIMRLLHERSAKILSGSISFDGLELLSLTEKQMQAIRGGRIAMIFQDPMTSLNPSLTVGRQMREALELHNYEKKSPSALDERVDELLKLVGIDPSRKKSYPHEFSGGMKQRIVIATALACNPELLIADEPTSALDVTIQAQVLALMENLKQTLDMAMIMITHDLGIIAKTCDTIGVVYAGEIIEFGTFEDIFLKKEHHPYTIGLFESIPNIHSNEKRLNPIEGLMPDPTNLPSGCRFHPRCKKCSELCKTTAPEQYTFGSHKIKCHLFAKGVNELG